MKNIMNRKAFLFCVILFIFLFCTVYANAQEWVTFESKTKAGEILKLTGILTIPNGKGPFPAVVMLCGSGGLKNKDDARQQKSWAERLMSWGYASLQVDSFGPRGYDNVSENGLLVDDMM
jgi:dienelactone hydrolase